MTNDDIKALLERIVKDGFAVYPITEAVDPRYAVAIGAAAGAAYEGLKAVEEDRDVRFISALAFATKDLFAALDKVFEADAIIRMAPAVAALEREIKRLRELLGD